MTENSQNSADERYIPLDEDGNANGKPLEGQEYLDPAELQQPVINFNINDAAIALVKEKFKDVDAGKDMDEAKAAKKVLTKMRTTLAEAHKEQKAESLAYGRMLDAEKNRLLELIAEVEYPIKKQIADIVNAAALAEDIRKGTIMGHMDRLASYALDRHDLNVEQIKERRANLAKEPLTEEIYEGFLAEAKMAHEEADTKLRIVLQRELDADIEREKQAKIAEENAARQKELDKQQAGLDAQAEAQRREQEKIAKDNREKQAKEDAERQAELDKQAVEQAAKQKKIDDENARLAQEKADKEEADRKAVEEEVARKTKLERAPDRKKLLLYASDIEQLVDTGPVMQSQEGANTLIFACEQLTEVADTVRKCVEEMK